MAKQLAAKFSRLSKDVVPVLYRITIAPSLEDFVFEGEEEIDLVVKNPVDKICINVAEITLRSARLKTKDGETAGDIKMKEEEEKACITFNKPILKGKATLYLNFAGTINDKMRGFYRCKNIEDGQLRYSASTQFAATNARRAFPCWDEPDFKAKFRIKIIAPNDLEVISNTDIIETNPDPTRNGFKIVQFSETPVMSTYILAYIVGRFDYIQTSTQRGHQIRIYTPRGRKSEGYFALGAAEKLLTFFEDYFDLPYPLKKLDHIAISDFAYRAMENWGLITYREEALLFKETTTSNSEKMLISKVMAHETAHQWFGNLVTHKWWTHLWLKEGFATFMQYFGLDHIDSHYNAWGQFYLHSLVPAFKLDSFADSHPIEVPVDNPSEIDSIYDDISYNKGASIIRMLFHWLGEKAFKLGTFNYLKSFAYKNAETEDLWSCLTEAALVNVAKTMNSWTKQTGYPVLNVSLVEREGRSELFISQEKFCFTKAESLSASMLWDIPIEIISSSNPKKVFMSDFIRAKETRMILPSSCSWIKLNPGKIGFYRVNYDQALFNSLKEPLRLKTLQPIDRADLLDDLLYLNLAGYVSGKVLLESLENYADENDFLVLAVIDKCLERLDSILSYTDYYDSFHSFGLKLLTKIRTSQKDDLNKFPMVIGRLISFGCKTTSSECVSLFKNQLNGVLIKPDLKCAVYQAVASSEDQDLLDELQKMFDSIDSQQERLTIANALGVNKHFADWLLNVSKSDKIRTQDKISVVLSVTKTPEGREKAWKFFLENFNYFKEQYGSHRLSSNLIQGLIEGFADKRKASEIAEFFMRNPFPGKTSIINRAIESINVNASWIEREREGVKAYLDSHD